MQVKAENRQVTGPEVVSDVLRAVLRAEDEVDQAKEHFWVLGLDSRRVIKYVELVSLGILNASLAHPREVFRLAIMKAVESIIIVHNHPSGYVQPSGEDNTITKRLVDSGTLLGIDVVDHVIIAESGGYYSYRDSGAI